MLHLAEEVIIFTRDDDLFHFLREVIKMLQVDSVILDTDKLMCHSLVSPLVQKRRDRVLLPVHNQQMSLRRVPRHSVDEVTLLSQFSLCLLSDILA